MRAEVRATWLLATAQALLLTNGVMLIAINGLVGLSLAPTRRLATLAITTMVLGSALSTLPASLLMRRAGRRAGFVVGALCGALGAAIGVAAVMRASFWLLCVGTLFSGVYNAFGQYYRLAAADVASEAWRSRAISLTLAGGLVGAFLGPYLGTHTRDLLAPRFVGSYATLSLLALCAAAVVSRLQVPSEQTFHAHERGRPWAELLQNPKLVAAVLSSSVAYGVMNLLMSATPIAMQQCGFAFSDASFVLQWHVVGMFLPSFFTGGLIRRFGVMPILLTGAALMLACVLLAMRGIELSDFFGSLALLGVAWNFLFVGGTALLTETYQPAEKAKVQGGHDLVVFVAMLASSLTSGVVVTGGGWDALNRLALPVAALTLAALLVLRARIRGARA